MFTTALAVRPDEETEVRNDCASSACCNEGPGRLNHQDENALDPGDGVAPNLPLTISKGFIADVLKPYRTHAQYLKSAELTHFRDKSSPATNGKDAGLIKGSGRFSIDRLSFS